MTRRAITIFLVLALVAASSPAWTDSVWERVGERIDVSGSKTYSLYAISVDGNREMFNDDNYGLSGRYRNETNLTLTGKLFSGLSLTATLTNNRWNPNDRMMTLNYDKSDTKASIGDITASLTGNELISFSKRLRGATITRKFGFGTVTAIASRTKAATKTVTVAGNNTPGPYYLGASQIVDGSERVKIDEREIPRSDSSTGEPNYTFDAFSGILTFRDGMIVSSTSEITVSFETQGYNTTSGSLYGVRSDIPVGKKANFGLTHMTQRTGSNSNDHRQVTEPFYGNNSLSLPYELMYIPLEGSLIVKIDGVLQTPAVDYTVNYPLHYILFVRPIPSSSTVLVTYIPKPENTVSGDRTVTGFDAKFKVSENLTLLGQLARSSGALSDGNATALRATGKYGKLDFTANLRSIDESFAPIDSVGFFRNERGGNIDLKYSFTDHLNWFSRMERFKRPDYRTTVTGTGLGITAKQSVNGLEWRQPKMPRVKLSRTTSENTNGADYNDNLSTDALTVSWDARKFGATTEISRSSRTSTYLSATGPELITRTNTSDTKRLSLRYLPGQKFSLTGDIAASDISNSDGSGTDAKNYSLTANLIPVKNVTLGLSYRISDSGGNYSTAYGGYTGIGGSYSGGSTGLGGYSGYPVGSYMPSYGQKQSSRIFTLGWNPSSRLAIDANYNYTSGEGENNTNTSISGYDFGFSYNPIEKITLRGNLSNQDGSFIGSGGEMSSKLQFLTLSLGPYRKFDLDLNYQKMLSGTTLTGLSPDDPYQNSVVDLSSIGGVLRRDIGGGRYAFLEFLSSSTGGIIANNKSVTSIGLEYPLNQILALKVDWRFIDYTDTKTPANNYRANMINAQIGARFR